VPDVLEATQRLKRNDIKIIDDLLVYGKWGKCLNEKMQEFRNDEWFQD
jgi:hypothetical protein